MNMPESNAYWRKTIRLTIGLFVLWVLVTFVVTWYARELNAFVFLGFPFGFYMGAQGALFIYLAIIWYYNRRMRALDAEYGIDDE
jgi:putative solute:sodium symporter small subunit